MDNGYFEGYRIDINTDISQWDLSKELNRFGVYYLPGMDWYCIKMFNANKISLLWMDERHSTYQCPINKYDDYLVDIYESLWESPIDSNGEKEIIKKIKLMDIYKHLKEKFKISVKFGKFLLVN